MSQFPRLHHVGIIMPSDEQTKFLCSMLGFSIKKTVYVKEYEAMCYFISNEHGGIEFIIPEEGSKLSKFNKGIGGLHHIAIEVDSVQKSVAKLKDSGIEFLEENSVTTGYLKINFIPPSQTRGIIIELVERQD